MQFFRFILPPIIAYSKIIIIINFFFVLLSVLALLSFLFNHLAGFHCYSHRHPQPYRSQFIMCFLLLSVHFYFSLNSRLRLCLTLRDTRYTDDCCEWKIDSALFRRVSAKVLIRLLLLLLIAACSFAKYKITDKHNSYTHKHTYSYYTVYRDACQHTSHHTNLAKHARVG